MVCHDFIQWSHFVINSYSPTAKVSFLCPKEDKQKFISSYCSVTISIGQKAQEGYKLAATLNLINKHFKHCTIMVCDTLQRHTLAIDNNFKDEELYNIAKKMGDSWLKNNTPYFKEFNIPYQIIRWDSWLIHTDYKNKRNLIDSLFDEKNDFRQAFYQVTDQFYERYKKRHSFQNVNLDFLYSCCLKYLKEECAVMLLWADKGYNFEIYPSKRNKAMEATHEYLIKPRFPDVLKPVALEIRTITAKHPLPSNLDAIMEETS